MCAKPDGGRWTALTRDTENWSAGHRCERTRTRLEFSRKELNFNANQDSAQLHLKKLYSKYLPIIDGATPEDEPAPPA